MFVYRRSNNEVKVETFPIKRARVRKEIGPCFSHVLNNLTFTHRLKLPLSGSFTFFERKELRRQVSRRVYDKVRIEK